MYLVIRKFKGLRSVQEAAQRAQTGLIALVRKSPGCLGYCIFDAGDGVGGSITFFTDRDRAVEANARALAWINASLPDLFDGEPEIIFGEALFASGGFTPTPPSRADMTR